MESLRTDVGADIPELGEHADEDGLLEELDPGGAAGALLEADDALDGFHVAEAPERELLLDIDEFFAHLVGGPGAIGLFVDGLEDGDDLVALFAWLGPVALDGGGGDGVACACEVAEELVVEAWGVEGGFELCVDVLVVLEDAEGVGVFVAEEELDEAVLVGLEA